MATNIYAPDTCELSKYGFRWCKKDQRWERRKAMSAADARMLANKVGFRVEIIDEDDVRISHVPVSDDPVVIDASDEDLSHLGELFQEDD